MRNSVAILVGLAVAGVLLLGASTRVPPKRLHAEFPGRAPSIAFDARGVLHVAYVDDRGVIHRDFATNESVVVSPVGSRPDARGEVGPILTPTLVVVYSNRTDARSGSTLVAQRSADGGRTWSAPQQINDDDKVASHSFTDVAVNRAGESVVSWLDSRSGHQGVRTAVVRASTVTPNTSVDAVTCECCRTSLLTASDGRVWIAYRDYAEGNIRNMAYAISRDNGRTFSAPQVIADDHWSINGCPESGPRLTQTSDGNVMAAWFNGAASAIELAAFRGKSFERPRIIAAPAGDVTLVNHPEVGTLPDGRVVVFYEAALRDSTKVVMARAGDDAPVIVARNATGPRYARRGDRAAISFTERRSGNQIISVLDWRDAIKDHP